MYFKRPQKWALFLIMHYLCITNKYVIYMHNKPCILSVINFKMRTSPEFFLCEENNLTEEQKEALLEMYELKVKYVKRMGVEV